MQFLIMSLLFFSSIFSLSSTDYLYYPDGKLDKNGILVLKGENETDASMIPRKTTKITKHSRMTKATNVDDTNFQNDLFMTSDIENINTSQPLNASEFSCYNVRLSHEIGFYGLFGFTYKALYISNVYAPSITYMLKSGPSQVKYKDGILRQVDQSCDSDDAINYLSFTLYNSGYASTECFPNDVMPEQISKCTNGRQVSRMCKGFRIGKFEDLYSRDVKDLLLRFGAVLIDNMIILGWKDINSISNWIAAVRDPIEYKYIGEDISIDDSRLYSGYVLFQTSSSGMDIGTIIGIVVASIPIIIGIINVIVLLYYYKCCKRLCSCSCCCSYSCRFRCTYRIQKCLSCKCCSCCCRSSQVVENYDDFAETNVNQLNQETEVSSERPTGLPIYALPSSSQSSQQSSQQTSYPATTDAIIEQQQPVVYPSSYDAAPDRNYRQHPVKYPSSYTASVDSGSSQQPVKYPSSYTASLEDQSHISDPVEAAHHSSAPVEDDTDRDVSEDS